MYIELKERYTNNLTGAKKESKEICFFKDRNIARGITEHGVYFMCEGGHNFED